jgi:hypothetical protein
MLSILNYLIFQRITFTVLVVLEELELMEKLFYLALTKRFFYVISKLIGMKLPTENIAGFEPDPTPLLHLLNKDKTTTYVSTKTKTDTTSRSSNNSFGPRRPNANDRRSY